MSLFAKSVSFAAWVELSEPIISIAACRHSYDVGTWYPFAHGPLIKDLSADERFAYDQLDAVVVAHHQRFESLSQRQFVEYVMYRSCPTPPADVQAGASVEVDADMETSSLRPHWYNPQRYSLVDG